MRKTHEQPGIYHARQLPDALIEQAAIVVRFLRRIVHRLRGRPESTAAAGAARTDRTP